jgi:hypothetical protein
MGVRPLIGLGRNFLSALSEFLPLVGSLWGLPQQIGRSGDFPKLVDLQELSPLVGLLWGLPGFVDLQLGLL